MVTTHLYDGVRNLPLDVAQYVQADFFEKGCIRSRIQEKTGLSVRTN